MSQVQGSENIPSCCPVYPDSGEELETVKRAWMFIDLVDSTAWYISQDEENALKLLRKCIAQMGSLVHDFHGEVIKLLGDGVHAGFEQPIDALLCAIVFQQEMLRARASSNNLFPSARVGLSYGVSVRCELCERVDYYGCAVILAARLAQLGRVTEVVMSEEFHRDRKIRETLHPVPVKTEKKALKGFPEPVSTYRIKTSGLSLVKDGDLYIYQGLQAPAVRLS